MGNLNYSQEKKKKKKINQQIIYSPLFFILTHFLEEHL